MSTTQPEALRENYTAADMATAAAQGFRDGVASAAASAGSEPVAWPKNAAEVRDFFNSDFISAKFAAPDQSPCDEDRYYISAHDFLSAINWWADFPHHPSPPEGMAGWRLIETAPRGISVLLYIGGSVTPMYCGRRRFGTLGEPQQDVYAWRCDSSGRFAKPTHWMPLPAPPLASEAKEL